MINSKIISEFANKKEVEVFTNNTFFRGSVKTHCSDGINVMVIVTPVDEWSAKQYGPASIDINAVIAIREIFPREKDDYDDCSDCTE